MYHSVSSYLYTHSIYSFNTSFFQHPPPSEHSAVSSKRFVAFFYKFPAPTLDGL